MIAVLSSLRGGFDRFLQLHCINPIHSVAELTITIRLRLLGDRGARVGDFDSVRRHAETRATVRFALKRAEFAVGRAFGHETAVNSRTSALFTLLLAFGLLRAGRGRSNGGFVGRHRCVRLSALRNGCRDFFLRIPDARVFAFFLVAEEFGLVFIIRTVT